MGGVSGESGAYFAEACATGVSKDMISWITERVLDEMNAARPLEKVCAAIQGRAGV